MNRTKPIGGYSEIRFNGNLLEFRSELTWNFQKAIKKGVAGRDGRVHGFTVEPHVPFIEGDFTHSGRYKIADLEAIADAVVTSRLADGRVLTLRGAFVAGEIAPTGDDAKVKIRFEGEDGEELAA
jgi:hypothetical protein